MRKITIGRGFGKTSIELYDSIFDFTINRYNEFQLLALEDIGIGSDVQSIGTHFSQLHLFLQQNKLTEAWNEAKNLHNNIYFAIEKINTKSLCFAPFIYKIDGKETFKDFAPESFSFEKIKSVLSDLSNRGLRQRDVIEQLDEIKKKLMANLEPIFLIDTVEPDQLITLDN